MLGEIRHHVCGLANGVRLCWRFAACGVPILVIDNHAEEMTGRYATTATSFSITGPVVRIMRTAAPLRSPRSSKHWIQ